MKNIYYKGKLIPAKDWDFENRRPKVKAEKIKKTIEEPVVEEKEIPLEADLEG